MRGLFAVDLLLCYFSVMSAFSGVFSPESPTRRANLPGSLVHFCAGVSP